MSIPSKKTSSESKPEQYLREIRDLQRKNLEILEKLTEYEDSKITRGRWAIGGKVLATMLPYLLSMALVWGFYMKIEDLTTSVTDTVKNLPKTMSIDISGKVGDWKEKGGELLNNWRNKN